MGVLALLSSVSGEKQTCSGRLPLDPALCEGTDSGIGERGKVGETAGQEGVQEEREAGRESKPVCGAGRRKEAEHTAPWLRNVFLTVIIIFPFLLLFVLVVSSDTSGQEYKNKIK